MLAEGRAGLTTLTDIFLARLKTSYIVYITRNDGLVLIAPSFFGECTRKSHVMKDTNVLRLK
jgi:hypothetical protein